MTYYTMPAPTGVPPGSFQPPPAATTKRRRRYDMAVTTAATPVATKSGRPFLAPFMSSSWTRGSLAGIERWPATTRRRCGRPSGTSIRAGTLVQFNLPLLLACCCSGTECSCVESARKLYFHREN